METPFAGQENRQNRTLKSTEINGIVQGTCLDLINHVQKAKLEWLVET